MLAKRSASQISGRGATVVRSVKGKRKSPVVLGDRKHGQRSYPALNPAKDSGKQELIANPCGNLCARGESSVKEQQSAHV